jgi:hypothetical protein
VTTFACDHCGAELAFAGVRTATCPYCTSPNFVERPATADHREPQFVVTFVGDAASARRALDRWLGRWRPFADPALRHATVEDLRGVYVPAYVYSAVAHTEFTAQIGEHYTETETHSVREPDGTRRIETRTVTRTEYRPLAGRHVGYITDLLVSASAGLSDTELARVEPFDLRQLRRFAPTSIAGWIAEEFARPAPACRTASHAAAIESVGDKLRRFLPGDSYSDLSWNTAISWESLDPILVPVWVLAVRYRRDRPVLRVLINGQSGRITGKVPLATWKLVVTALVLAAVVGLLVLARLR